MFEEAKKQNLKTILCAYPPISKRNHHIYFGAHYEDLPLSNVGFKIHIDHAPKGIGAATYKFLKILIRKRNIFHGLIFILLLVNQVIKGQKDN